MGSAIDRDDLVQEGMLGLMQSLKTYDYSRGAFTPYATWSIRNHIFRALKQRASFVAISVNVQEEFQKINRMINLLRTRLNREPTKEEIAEANRISVERLEKVIQRVKISREIISLDEIAGPDRDSEMSLHEIVASDVKTPEEIFVEEAVSLRLQKKIQAIFRIGILNARERHYLERLFGLERRDPENLSVIGRKEGLSRERVRQKFLYKRQS